MLVDGYNIEVNKCIPVNMEVVKPEPKTEIVFDVLKLLEEEKPEEVTKPYSEAWYLDLLTKKHDVETFYQCINTEVNDEKERIEEEKRKEEEKRRQEEEEKRRCEEEQRKEAERIRLEEERKKELQEQRLREQEERKRNQEQQQKQEQEKKTTSIVVEEKPEVKREEKVQAASGWETYNFSSYYPANTSLQGGMYSATGIDLRTSKYKNGHRILAGPPHLPFGTIVEVEVGGQRFTGIIEDRGGAIKGNRIDILSHSHEEAYSFGRQTGKLRVIS